MADYCTVNDIKELGADVGLDVADYDEALASLITKVSRAIDRKKKREANWFVALTTAAARYYDGDGETIIYIDECVEITEVEVDGTVWAATDYQALGHDMTVNILPLQVLRVDNDGDYSKFTKGQKKVKVTAKWGYSVDVDENINLACIAQVIYTLQRFQQGLTDQGGISELGFKTLAHGWCREALDYLREIPDRVA